MFVYNLRVGVWYGHWNQKGDIWMWSGDWVYMVNSGQWITL